MLRPLIESIYDYRMVFTPEHPSARPGFKHNYLQSCAFLASEHVLKELGQPQAQLQQVIGEWNSRNKQAQKERGSNDYKAKLDDLFKESGKCYYKGRQYDRASRERSIDSYDNRFKESSYKDSRHGDSRYEDKESRHQYSVRSHHSHHKSDKHRSDRH